MLGKRPCLLRTSSSRSLLVPCDDAEGKPASFCHYVQVAERNPSPALASPCKIVIGFNIGAEKKPPPDVCESPRSVLDTSMLLPPRDKQQIVTRSPRSGLGSLLTGNSGSEDNVGLEIVAEIQPKGVDAHVHVVSAAGSRKPTLVLPNCLHQTGLDYSHGNMRSLCVKPGHSHSKESGWAAKTSNFDLMEEDVSPWQGRARAPCVHLQGDMEDECLDADISPRRIMATHIRLNQDMKYDFNHVNITSPCQSKGLLACPSKGSKIDCMDADISPQHVPWQSLSSQVPPRMGEDNDSPIFTWQCRASHVPPTKGVVDDCMIDHIPTLQSEAPCVHLCKDDCTDAYITPWQRRELHHGSGDMEDCEEISVHQSIFSAASPPSYPYNLIISSTGFLNACAFCGHTLRLGKDIYMYRGDQAFCSAECRYHKIASDEHKEKRGS